MSDVDLFGRPVDYKKLPEPAGGKRRRKTPKRAGYAAVPGTGPEGESCKTCDHRVLNLGKYSKCLLMRAHWTGGYGSDILVKSPACKHWKEIQEDGR